jgi:hypothetical protein
VVHSGESFNKVSWNGTEKLGASFPVREFFAISILFLKILVSETWDQKQCGEQLWFLLNMFRW